MTKKFDMAVDLPGRDDLFNIIITVDFVREDVGIGSYEYAGIPGRDINWMWIIEDWRWDNSQFTEEENNLINEECHKNAEQWTRIISKKI